MRDGRAIFLCLCLLADWPAIAAESAGSRVRLLDAGGAPLTGAVVWFGGGSPARDDEATAAVVEQIDKQFVPRTTVVRTEVRSLSDDGQVMSVSTARDDRPPMVMVYEKQ